MTKAVFFDRDGTLIEDRDYLKSPDQVVFFPGAIAALARLLAAGYRLVMVTNQSGVGRGYFTMEEVEAVHRHMETVLAEGGVQLTAIYYAPEAPEERSRGRKPSPQFLFDAHDQYGIELSESFMIGDKWSDLECGWNAGVRKCLLVRTGKGKEVERSRGANLGGAIVCDSFPDAVDWILSL